MAFPASLHQHKALVVIALLAIIAAGWLVFGKSNDEAESKQRTVQVEIGTVEDVVTAQGKLEPKEFVNVGAQVSGQIKKIHVEIGDNVTKDQLLAELDPRIYQSRLEASEAQLNAQKAQAEQQRASLTLAEQQHKRNSQLIDSKAISQDAFEQSKSALIVARARLKSIQALIDEIESGLKADRTNLEYTKIYAPMAGTVATLPVREGQTVNASQTAPTLMRIANYDVMTVRAQVAEADVMRLTSGMQAYFTTLGDTEKRFVGTVRQIQPTPDIISDVVLFNVLIDAENTERLLMDGMSCQVFFVLGKAENVPLLPVEALIRRSPKEDSEEGKAYYVQVKGQKEPVLIRTGFADRMRAEVRSGLKQGDVVILPAREKPRSGGGGGRSSGPRL
jgi:macrolide-specific efflux system membrane fusion protein